MGNESAGEERRVWAHPLLQWSNIERVKARLPERAEQAPEGAGGIHFSNIGREFYSWWLNARGGRPMPAADDVDPRALVELLPYLRYLGWEDEERLVFRIYGSALVEAGGIDLTGYDVFNSFDPVQRKADQKRLRLLHEQPCGIVMIRDIPDRTGRIYPCEFLTLPIAPGEDGKNRVIGTVVPATRMAEWNVDVVLDRTLTLRQFAFLDIGFGTPED
jgi:hypothetical protein